MYDTIVNSSSDNSNNNNNNNNGIINEYDSSSSRIHTPQYNINMVMLVFNASVDRSLLARAFVVVVTVTLESRLLLPVVVVDNCEH